MQLSPSSPRNLNIHKKMAKIHKYWSRKPWNLMEYEIKKNSFIGDVVLDPFCGSGSVGLEAVLAGRNFIGYDLNPFAVSLSKSTLNKSFDIVLFDQNLERIIEANKTKIMNLYEMNGDYVLYTIPGKSNKKDYNVVLCDEHFKKLGNIYDPNLEVEFGTGGLTGVSIPDADFPSRFYKDRFSYKGVKKVSDLFSNRNLIALSILRDSIENLPEELKLDFSLVLTNTLLHVSKLKSENIRPLGVNNYWIPDDFIEENVLWRFIDRAKQFRLAKLEIGDRFQEARDFSTASAEIICDSSIPLKSIDSNSIDYILTDPPYGDVIQYSELSLVWNVWLGTPQNSKDELIVNPAQDKDEKYFLDQISLFLTECFRVLKDQKKLTLCFQNKDPNIWFEVAKAARDSGFTFSNIETFDFLGSTFNKNWSGKSPKVDIYLTLLKSTEISSNSEVVIKKTLRNTLEGFDFEKNGKFVENVKDKFSLAIAIGVVEVFNGVDLDDSSINEINRFILSDREEGILHAEDRQPTLF